MKLSNSLLLIALLGTATAASDSAKVYTFPVSEYSSTGIPSLSPEEARLVIAKRLGVSQYHGLLQATEYGIRYINDFGGKQTSLFRNPVEDNERSHLVMLVEGITSELESSFATLWDAARPAFEISNPPSKISNAKLIEEMMAQSSVGTQRKECSVFDAIDPFHEECWSGTSNFVHFDVKSSETAGYDFLEVAKIIFESAKNNAMDVMIILMPKSSRISKDGSKPYGSYDMPAHLHHVRGRDEEIISANAMGKLPSSNIGAQPSQPVSPTEKFKTIIPRCHGSADSCNAATSNCTGHGTCLKKFGNDGSDACYACACIASVNITKGGYKQSIYWGGSACQKEDISAQFWLLAGISVAGVGLISWGVGMLFSIGEEQLPGVIGAGVSGPKAR